MENIHKTWIVIGVVILVGGLIYLAGFSVRSAFVFNSPTHSLSAQVAATPTSPTNNGAVLGDETTQPGSNPVRGIYVNPFGQ